MFFNFKVILLFSSSDICQTSRSLNLIDLNPLTALIMDSYLNKKKNMESEEFVQKNMESEKIVQKMTNNLLEDQNDSKKSKISILNIVSPDD